MLFTKGGRFRMPLVSWMPVRIPKRVGMNRKVVRQLSRLTRVNRVSTSMSPPEHPVEDKNSRWHKNKKGNQMHMGAAMLQLPRKTY